jgi:hypothetical protein
MADFYDVDKTNGIEVASKNYRGGSRINVNTKKVDEYWFSKFCQENNIRLVMGGHKHTQAISWPIKENVLSDGSVNSMKPIIQVTLNDLKNYFGGSTKLITIVDNSDLNGQSFPNKWFKETYQNDDTSTRNNLLDDCERNCHFCTFELVDAITAPVYSMSQATGYKHTSNKELPAQSIPWCRHYYPSKRGKDKDNNITSAVDKGQRYPFYSVYTVTNDNITIDVKRVLNVLVEGKFNINEQGESLRTGKTQVETNNGLDSSGLYNNVIISK